MGAGMVTDWGTFMNFEPCMSGTTAYRICSTTVMSGLG